MKSTMTQLQLFTMQLWNREFEERALSKPDNSFNWHQKCCRLQPSTELPSNISCQAHILIHQLRLN